MQSVVEWVLAAHNGDVKLLRALLEANASAMDAVRCGQLCYCWLTIVLLLGGFAWLHWSEQHWLISTVHSVTSRAYCSGGIFAGF